jgi:AcrR family transcriptional regulator
MARKTRADLKAETRRALLDAGAALFGKHGLDAPSLDAICERAGYTRGAFYVHFTDRDDFLAAVMEHAGLPILDRVMAGADIDDLAAVFARFLAAFADGTYPLSPEGGIRVHQLLDACARSPRVRERYVELITESIERLRRGIARSQDAAQIRDDVDARLLATVIIQVVIGAQTMAELDAGFEIGQSAQALLALLLRPAG